MRAWISIASALLAASLSGGCSLTGSALPPGRPVRDVYEDGSQAPTRRIRLERAPTPGAFQKTRPVVYPPKIFAVYVPEHLDKERDMKIGAHWVYVKLRDSSWFEEPIDREPLSMEDSTDEEIYAIRRRMSGSRFGRILVPHQAAPPRTMDAAGDNPAPRHPLLGVDR